MADKSSEFIKLYNIFDGKPLAGKSLDRFYVRNANDESVRDIEALIGITENTGKNLLVIGQTGCGKSTLLNKLSKNLEDKYHIVSFSVADSLNIMDIETADILLSAYLQLIYSLKKKNIRGFPKSFNPVMKILRKELGVVDESGLEALHSVSFKIMVETEARKIIRNVFGNQTRALAGYLSDACREVSKLLGKDLVIVVDDSDKVPPRFADRIFFRDTDMLTEPDVKMLFAFPLSSYYDPAFDDISDKFEYELVNLEGPRDREGDLRQSTFDWFSEIVYKRADRELIARGALEKLTEMSGGLVRDMIVFMRNACKLAVKNNSPVIDEETAAKVVNMKISEFDRFFDFPERGPQLEKIIETKFRDEIVNDHMIHFLRHNFVLKYGREEEQSWYDAHPCLKARIAGKAP